MFWLKKTCVAHIVVFGLLSGGVYGQVASSSSSSILQNQREHINQNWQIGVFFAGGFVPSYEVHTPASYEHIDLNFFNSGFVGGKMVTGTHGAGIVRGRGEALVEVIPFWLAYYPRQTIVHHFVQDLQHPEPSLWGPYRSYGASITPVLFRWNFIRQASSRSVPWAQLGGGLLWTDHKFPLLGNSTSVINFTPQVDIGDSIFLDKNHSVDFAIKAVHISNASLGDNNPGLNVTLQFSVGYSWWK